MRALTWQGREDVRAEDVPDPSNQDPTDAILRTRRTSLEDAAHGYDIVEREDDGAIKVVLDPAMASGRGEGSS